MNRYFTIVLLSLRREPVFRGLLSDDARLLYLYLLTSPHVNSAGCYVLPEEYACADLKWAPERYHAARIELVENEMVCFDPKHEVVFITAWFKHNPVMN